MSFQAQCPHCHKHANAPDGAVGKNLRCPHCQEMYTVQHEPEAAAPAPALPAVTGPPSACEYHIEDITEAVVAGGTVGRTPTEKRKAMSIPIQQRLNALGAEGWELTTSEYFSPVSTNLTEQLGFWKLIFKRPRHTP
jgi:hypothetical protein